MFAHLGLPLGFESSSLPDRLHDLERVGVREPVADQVEHNAVARPDDLRDIADARLDEVLRVAEPDVGAVGQARDLEQIGKVFRLRVHQHPLDKVSPHLGQTVGAELAPPVLLGGDPQGFCAFKELIDRRIVHFDVENAGVRVALEHLVLGRNIVSEFVEFQDRVVQIRELEVRGLDIRIGIVRRVLDRGEVRDVVLLRYDDDAAGVLTGRAFDPAAAGDQPLDLGARQGDLLLLEVFHHVAEGGF